MVDEWIHHYKYLCINTDWYINITYITSFVTFINFLLRELSLTLWSVGLDLRCFCAYKLHKIVAMIDLSKAFKRRKRRRQTVRSLNRVSVSVALFAFLRSSCCSNTSWSRTCKNKENKWFNIPTYKFLCKQFTSQSCWYLSLSWLANLSYGSLVSSVNSRH